MAQGEPAAVAARLAAEYRRPALRLDLPDQAVNAACLAATVAGPAFLPPQGHTVNFRTALASLLTLTLCTAALAQEMAAPAYALGDR